MDLDFDQVLPELYVGSCPTRAEEIDFLKQTGVTAVLSLQTDDDLVTWGLSWPRLADYYGKVGIEGRRVPIGDFDAEDLRRKLPAGVKALDELLSAGRTVYLHCSGGVNRSPSVAIAYLHWILGWDLDRAANHVKQRHPSNPYVDAIRLASEDREVEEDRET